MSLLRFKVLTFDVAGTPIDCRRDVPDYLHEVASGANVSDRDFLSAYRAARASPLALDFPDDLERV